ncbi:hypothetical protein JG688_00016675 [Phytophthora aleatoria]|uniref:ATP-dependent DNA helicase n=1 Tax=Phytophthora aleatoria TaxID=2496075 RepID=A0A8J5I435_9STRA|nr:hypothetical protein JG688_00016675 [Phytophthora aleatoria]
MKKWVKNTTTDNTLGSNLPASLIATDTKVIELLGHSLLKFSMAWHAPAAVSRRHEKPKSFASISDASEAYTLNEKQHYALMAIARALLTRWKRAQASEELTVPLNDCFRDNQLLLFLSGEGGTGKSRIVDAIQDFCDSWGRRQCLIKAALTGKAVTLIRGRTLAGFLLQIRQNRVSDPIANLDLLIIDEVSMTKKFQLAQLDQRLRVAKRVQSVAFGGVLVGDFLQLPPVGGDPIYKALSQRRWRRLMNLPEFNFGVSFTML